MKTFCAAAALCCLLTATAAFGQLRIVTYNTNTFGTEVGGSNIRRVRPTADIVFEAIAEETVAGIARAPDVVLLQEQQQPDTTTADLVNRLNAIFADDGITYARGFEVGRTTSGTGLGTPNSNEIRQSVVYRTDTLQLIDEDSFGAISGPRQPRETLLHHFRPSGYGPEADLYLFNSHFEAGDGTSDRFARESESQDIRNYIAANVPSGANVILGGDLNVDSTSERSTSNATPWFEILTGSGDDRLIDPLNPTGARQVWHNNSSFARVHTQSPSNGAGALVAGGVDDRFDFLLTSEGLLDDEGVSLIADTYRAFGNNGTSFNRAINDRNTIQIQGLETFTTAQVLDALESASDHLPVIAEFQLPAILDATLVGVDGPVVQGSDTAIRLRIENAAPVDVAIGADELDYAVDVTGDSLFQTVGSVQADGLGVELLVPLDTSVVGSRSLLATVTTDSVGSPVSELVFDLDYEVIAALIAGDYNADGVVDAADYTVWRDTVGSADDLRADGNGDGFVDSADYELWAASLASAAAASVPEPASVGLVVVGLAVAVTSRRAGRRCPETI